MNKNTITPNQLYAREPEKIELIQINDYDYHLWGHRFNHIPEIDQHANFSKTERVQLRTYKSFNFDGRRFWTLASVWFKPLDSDQFMPVMIVRNAGREGDDFSDRFVTSSETYAEMITHIKSLELVNDWQQQTGSCCVNPNTEIENLLDFYNNSLDGYFERY